MKLSEVYSKNPDKPVISIEIFPPKGEGKEFQDKKEELFDELKRLNTLSSDFKKPSLVSITYGAGGKTRTNSGILTKEIKENFDFNIVMPHLTCVCSDKNFVEAALYELEGYKIDNILALRGDEPEDITVCYRDFKFASELVEFIKEKTSFEIAVAGYPEGHADAVSFEEDIKNLKNKVSKGANAIFTQFFFENEKFYNFLCALKKNGINLPAIAGILPVISYPGLLRMVKLSGIKPSKKALSHFEKWQYSKEDTIKAGIEWAYYQCEDLIKNKVDGIHFYTLNKSYSTVEILKHL